MLPRTCTHTHTHTLPLKKEVISSSSSSVLPGTGSCLLFQRIPPLSIYLDASLLFTASSLKMPLFISLALLSFHSSPPLKTLSLLRSRSHCPTPSIMCFLSRTRTCSSDTSHDNPDPEFVYACIFSPSAAVHSAASALPTRTQSNRCSTRTHMQTPMCTADCSI